MSNNLIPITAALPDFLKEVGGYQDDGMSNGIAVRAPRIGITIDKKWTITEEGATRVLETAVNVNGQQMVVATPSIRLVIVAASSTLTKSWYEKAYSPGQFEAPDCFSNDGKVPAPGVTKPQCTNCATCQKNAFGSHPVTGRGKACSDRKLLVVCWESAPDKLMTFNVPTMSLAALRKIDAELRNANVPMQSVMMELAFDQNTTYPVVKMGAIGFVDKETCLRLRDASTSDEVTSMLHEVDYDVPDNTAPVVPDNVIKFGATAGTVVATENAASTQATQQDPTPNSGTVETTARRKRRSQQEMAAVRAAEAAAVQQQINQQEANKAEVQPENTTPPVDDAAAKIAALQAQLAGLQAQTQQPNTVQQPVVEAGAVQGTVVATAQQSITTAQQPAAQASEVPANVLAMLSKWKT